MHLYQAQEIDIRPCLVSSPLSFCVSLQGVICLLLPLCPRVVLWAFCWWKT